MVTGLEIKMVQCPKCNKVRVGRKWIPSRTRMYGTRFEMCGECKNAKHNPKLRGDSSSGIRDIRNGNRSVFKSTSPRKEGNIRPAKARD